MVGLLVDDPEELARLGRVGRCGAQRGGRRAHDRGERDPELVAHHAEELGPQMLQLLKRRQVLQGNDHRFDRAIRRADRRSVDQRPDAPAVGDREHHFLGAHRLGIGPLLRERELVEGHLPAIGAPAGQHPQQLLQRAVGRGQTAHDPLRLPVERHRMAGPGVEDRDAHRRGVDQGLQIGPRPLLVSVLAGVGDRRRRLRGEQDQDLLVLARELRPALLPVEEEAADVHPVVAHGRAGQCLFGHQIRSEAQRPDVGVQVVEPNRARQALEVHEELRPLGPVDQLLVLLRREAGSDELLGLPGVVDGRDHAVAGADQRAGAVNDFPQHGVDIETCADPQDGRAERGDAVA